MTRKYTEGANGAGTPIQHHFRKYRALTMAAEAYLSVCNDAEDDELERLFYRERDEIEALALSLPIESPADFAARLIIATSCGTMFPDWEGGQLWIEARAMTGWNVDQAIIDHGAGAV